MNYTTSKHLFGYVFLPTPENYYSCKIILKNALLSKLLIHTGFEKKFIWVP